MTQRDEQHTVWLLVRNGKQSPTLAELRAALAKEGLQTTEVSASSRVGMDASEIVLTVVISVIAGIGANYLQDKGLSAKIDRALAVVKKKTQDLLNWSHHGPLF